jgi:hypothetical protein
MLMKEVLMKEERGADERGKSEKYKLQFFFSLLRISILSPTNL